MSPTTRVDGTAGAAPGAFPDPLPSFRFVAEIQGREIGQFAECTGLAVAYEVMEYAEGGNNQYVHQLRGRVRYPSVVLSRGLTDEDALLRWFFSTEQPTARPTLTISLNDHLGRRVRHFALAEALPVRWTGPEGASGLGATATEALEVAHAGFV